MQGTREPFWILQFRWELLYTVTHKLVHCRVTPQHWICLYPFIHLDRERQCKLSSKFLAQEHTGMFPRQARTWTARSTWMGVEQANPEALHLGTLSANLHTINLLHTVLVKCKLTVSTRNSISLLNAFENLVSRLKFRVLRRSKNFSRKWSNAIYISNL